MLAQRIRSEAFALRFTPPHLRALPPSPIAADTGPACRLADAVRGSRRVPPRLRAALLRACAEERPFRSVSRLAAAAGCDRRTLWREWRRAVGDASATRLEDVLHWLILARALALKTAERTWYDVAADLRVHPQTLSRFARQFTGLTLRRIATSGDAAAAMGRALLPSFQE
jgi:hypothetical protein